MDSNEIMREHTRGQFTKLENHLAFFILTQLLETIFVAEMYHFKMVENKIKKMFKRNVTFFVENL